MTGEMSAPVDEDRWSFHAMIRDIVDGELKPFDQYQGPYVDCENGDRLWLFHEQSSSTALVIYNEKNDEKSEPQVLPYTNEEEAKSRLGEMIYEVRTNSNKE